MNQFKINGLINTSNNVLDNLNQLANVSGCYLTWDPQQGKWIVILNTTSSSVRAFDDSNIIGEINVGGTGVNDLYNSVVATFPNKDTRDTTDQIQLTVPTADRFAQEIDNVLNIEIPIVNEPVQAAYIASRELKQSRLDKIIEFRANFEANTVRAGDVVDITNSALDFSSKLFRVIQIEEEDEDDGNLIFSITAQEYDPSIYDPSVGINNASGTSGLTYEYRSNFTGIKSKLLSEELDLKDDISIGKQMGGLLAANAALGLINSLFTVDEETGAIINEGKFADPVKQSLMNTLSCPDATVSISDSTVCLDPEEITISYTCDDCFFKLTRFVYTYEITGLEQSDITIPLTGYCSPVGSTGAFTQAILVDSNGVHLTDAEPTFAIRNNRTNTSNKPFTVSINNGDLNQSFTVTGTLIAIPAQWISSVSAGTPADGDKGSTITLPVTVGGTWTIGDTIAYTITDPAGIVSTPLTGTIAVTSLENPQASISVATTDDASCGTATVTVTMTHPFGTPPPCVPADNSQSISFYETANAVKLTSASATSVVEGNSSTVTLNSQNAANGTTVSYTISGSTSKITSPLSGTVTLNSNTATLTVNTSDDGIYTGTTNTPTITFTAIGSGCSNVTASITITEASTAPPADFNCEYVQVPIIWCGTFDGSTQRLKSLTVKKYAFLPLSPVGGTAVPTTLSVTNPGEATAAISIDSTVNIDPVTGAGGAQIDVITSFDSPPGGGDTLLTGTISTFNGYW